MKRKVFMAILAIMVTTIGAGGVVLADQADDTTSAVECGAEAQETRIEINEENFPDFNFREFLKGDTTFSIKEGEGLETKFYVNVAATDMKICISNIADITGIEYFDNLTNLVISGQETTQKSAEVAPDGMLECLELTKIPNLQFLTVENTTIKKMDLRKSVNLKSLTVLNNDIENLDLTECTYIKTVVAKNNKNLKSINATNCTTLSELDISDSVGITKLEAKGCTSLKTLKASGCKILKDIDVLEKYTSDMMSLKTLDLEGTPIDEVIIKELPNLETLNIKDCKSCYKVFVKDCPVLQSLVCVGCEKLENVNLYKTAVKELDISNLHCVNRLSLEECLALKKLNANNCLKLNEFFFKKLPDLEILELQDTSIETLDIDAFPNIVEVDVSESPIRAFSTNRNCSLRKVIAKNCSYLEAVDLSSFFICNLEEIDVSESKELNDLRFYRGDDINECCLKKLNVSGTSITTLDVEGLRYLADLNVNGCKYLWYLKMNDCTALSSLEISNCGNLTNLIIDDKNNIEKIKLSGISIEKLDVENFTKLQELEIKNCTNLLFLNTEGCSNLYILSINDANQLETIKVSDAIVGSLYFKDLKSLKELKINNCEKLTYLDICDCSNLSSFDVDENNKILILNLSGTSIEKLDLRKFSNLIGLEIKDCQELLCVNTENCEYLINLIINDCSKLEDLLINGDYRLCKLQLCGVPIKKFDISDFENLEVVDVSGCSCLSNLSFDREKNTKIKLINISKTAINECCVFKLASLEELVADDCNKLLTINADGCEKLTSLSFKSSDNLRYIKISKSKIQKFDVVGYKDLKSIVAFDCNELKGIKVTNCPELESISVSTSGSMEIVTKNCPLLRQTYIDHGDVSVVFK